MSSADIQGWVTLAVTLILLVRTFVGDGKKGFETNRAEIANLRANLADFQLKVAQEYARTDRLEPRLERIESLLTDLLRDRRSGDRHDR